MDIPPTVYFLVTDIHFPTVYFLVTGIQFQPVCFLVTDIQFLLVCFWVTDIQFLPVCFLVTDNYYLSEVTFLQTVAVATHYLRYYHYSCTVFGFVFVSKCVK